MCPNCQAKTKLYLDYRVIDKGDYALFKCQACGLIFTSPLPTDEFLDQFYQSYDNIGLRHIYYQNVKDYKNSRDGTELIKLFLNIAQEYNLPKNKKILDLGSGAGVFLDILKSNNYQGLGIELSQTAVKFAKSNFQVESVVGDVSQIELENSGFGAVFMWDILEHLKEQEKTIKRVYDWLADNGVLVIEIPNSNALINKIILLILWLGISWPAKWMFGPHHLFLHSKKSINGLLVRSGFKVLEIRTKNTASDRIFSWNKKFFIPKIVLSLINATTNILGGKNKLIIIVQK